MSIRDISLSVGVQITVVVAVVVAALAAVMHRRLGQDIVGIITDFRRQGAHISVRA
jgi:hypothetical protein